MKTCFLGVDSGTQSTRTIVVRMGDGKVLGSASRAHGLIKGLPAGHKEQHPRVWLEAVQWTVRAALRDAHVSSSQVVAMGVSGQQHGFVPLDARGRVIRPAKLWCDTSTAPQCGQLIRKLGGLPRVIRLIGNGIPAGFTASKILWLKQREPKNFARLRTVLLPHDYINFWLTGRRSMEAGDASGTALLDVRRRCWQREVMRAVDSSLLEKFPDIQPSHEAVGTLGREAALKLGLPSSVLVSAGGGDNMMGAIGTGNTKSGIVTASFGTSGTIYAYSPGPVVDPQGEIAAFCDSTGGWLPLVCTMNVTLATEMVRKCFQWSHEEMGRQAQKTGVGSHSMLLVPYLDGERTPNVPDGTGMFFGVNPHSFKPGVLARAAMEGVTMGMNYGLARMKTLGIRPRQIRVTGGGANNAVWRQIMADVFNCPVTGMKTSEGAAYGAALQAWWCFENHKGRRVNIHDITRRCVQTDPGLSSEPCPESAAIYRELQKLQDRAAVDLKEMFRLHRKLSSAQ